jgi:predicted HicB family RNase H-like nuclease
MLGMIGKPGGFEGEVLVNPFADTAEAAFAELRLRLSARLKHRVDMAARRTGVSVNTWLRRTVEAAIGVTVHHDPGV